MPCIMIHKPLVVLNIEKCYVCGLGNLHADINPHYSSSCMSGFKFMNFIHLL